jgi:hypothetical protein
MHSIQILAGKVPAPFLLLASFCAYVALAFMFPLLPNYDLQPPGDIHSLQPEMAAGLLYALIVILLFALYTALFLRIRRSGAPSLPLLTAAASLMALPLLFMYPINANDVFRYVIRGLIRSRFGANPYDLAPVDLGGSLYASLAGEWRGEISPYGPIWELTASFLTTIGGENLLLDLILFKLLGLLSLLVAGAVLWKLFSLQPYANSLNENRRSAFVLLWMLNPALLLTFVGNAHNDGMMIAILLLGWSIVIGGYKGPGFLIMMAAALIKPIALISLPFVFISCWVQLGASRERVVFLVWSVGGGLLLTAAAFYPFGSPLPLVSRLMVEASAGASFSPATLAVLAARESGWSGSFNVISTAASAVFILFLVWLLMRSWRKKPAEQNLAMAFWAYSVQALNFRIWYATWPFPWQLLSGYSGRRRAVYGLHASLWFLLTSQLSVIIYGHIRLHLLGGNHYLAHLIGVPFVFLLPFLLAWISFWRESGDRFVEAI